MTRKSMSLVLTGETKTQYVVNWDLNGEGKGEVFDTRAGSFKLIRQLKAIVIPFKLTRTRLSPMDVEGE